jgi:ssDNA-binding Zn-finger/Zn-ribbon topoisomerase 1
MMSELKTVEARLDIAVFVDCPKCDFGIDLLNPRYTNGIDHNEERYILEQACGNGDWSINHEKFEVEEVTCTKCKTEFNVKGMEW